MPDLRADDLAVVIPTRDRWDVLRRTLAAVAAQTAVPGEVVVVVDGTDQSPPELAGVRVLRKEHGGPGAARNAGAAATERPLLLFLGDDMIATPGLVAAHLERHHAAPADEVAVLGRADWHPDIERDRLLSWIDRSNSQFEFPPTAEDDAGFGRFYSCNVSLKRRFFCDAGGFDEDFVYYYEDLDCGWRLGQRGMRLVYAPDALALHLHRYDLAALQRRYAGIARGEWLMARKHEWFPPFFEDRIRRAEAQPPVSRVWPLVVDRIPASAASLRRRAERWSTVWYHQQLAPHFRAAWDGEHDLAELRDYLGPDFDEALLRGHERAVDDEERAATDEATFYRTSRMYLYDLTVFAMSGTKVPYLAALRRAVPPGSSVLDWGAGIGTDGLRLLDTGYRVAFAEFDNPSSAYLRWRLDRRGHDARVYDLDRDDIPGGFDAAYSLDVIEHVEDPFAFLADLERRAAVVMVNFLEPKPHETHLHKPLPIADLLDHAAAKGLVHYRRYHGRSHLVVYRTGVSSPGGRLRSGVERHLGGHRPA
jgi:GT2 family glycosyltransferase